MTQVNKYYCRTRQEVVGALGAALDMIETPVEINHKSGFQLILDLSKVPKAVSYPEWERSIDRHGRMRSRKHYPTAEEKRAALPAAVRYRQAIARRQRLVEDSPQAIWR